MKKYTEKELERYDDMPTDEFIKAVENMSQIEFANLGEQRDAFDELGWEVTRLAGECETFDDGIRGFFDYRSNKMRTKKKKVLQALIDGKAPDEIGNDYWDILELFDKTDLDENCTYIIGGWEFDPRKYKQK